MKTVLVLALGLILSFSRADVYAQDFSSPADERCDAVCLKMRDIWNNSSFLVSITTLRPMQQGQLGLAYGTGVIVSTADTAKAMILTNNHVISGAVRIWVSFSDGGFRKQATVKGRDPSVDLALIESDIPAGLSNVEFGEDPKVGEQVFALGHPFGMRSVTEGRINALRGGNWLFVLTQVPINPGNSGGPLFNVSHKMVGLNTAIIPGANNVGFTIPIRYVKKLIPRLVREKLVKHGDAGFTYVDAVNIIPYFFEQKGFDYPPPSNVVMIIAIEKNSPADQAGLQVGDVITKFEKVPVTTELALDQKIFFDHRPNDEVSFTVKRGDKEYDYRLRLKEASQNNSE